MNYRCAGCGETGIAPGACDRCHYEYLPDAADFPASLPHQVRQRAWRHFANSDATTAFTDSYVALFAAAPHASTAAWTWWYARYGSLKEARMDQTNLEDIEVMAREFLDSLPLEQRLAGLRPEDRLAGLRPEDRLAGLRPEDRLAGLRPEDRLAGLSDAEAVLAMPDTVLVGLSDAYVATLPDGVREQVTRRRNARAR